MAKYRKKPIVVEAEQWFPARGFSNPNALCYKLMCSNEEPCPHVHTIHKGQTVSLEIGDWVIAEPDGIHFYPCKPDIFTETYELI